MIRFDQSFDFGEEGDRFNIKHFYNIEGNEFLKLEGDLDKIKNTSIINKSILKIISEILNNNEINKETKKILKNNFNRYKILLSNFEKDNEVAKERIITFIEELYLDEEDEEKIINKIKKAFKNE